MIFYFVGQKVCIQVQISHGIKMLKFLILTILAIELCGCVQVTSLKTSNNGMEDFLSYHIWNLNTIDYI